MVCLPSVISAAIRVRERLGRSTGYVVIRPFRRFPRHMAANARSTPRPIRGAPARVAEGLARTDREVLVLQEQSYMALILVHASSPSCGGPRDQGSL